MIEAPPLIDYKIVEYNEVAAGLALLRSRYQNVAFDCNTTAGDKEARAARLELVRLRTGLEAKRKELKAPALERSRLIDDEAKRITAAIVALEEPIDKQIRAVEEARERAKAEREEEERRHAAILRARINAIAAVAQRAVGKPSADIAEKITLVEGIDVSQEVFGAMHADATAVHTETLAQLRAMLEATKAAEAERAEAEERLRQEGIRLARVNEFQGKLSELRNSALPFFGPRVSSESIATVIDSFPEIDRDEWEEFAPQAEDARTYALAQLRQAHGDAKERETYAAQQEVARQERLAEDRRFRAHQERLDAEQAEINRQRQEIEAQARAAAPVEAPAAPAEAAPQPVTPAQTAVEVGPFPLSPLDTRPHISTGKIGERLGFKLTQEFIETELGVMHYAQDKRAVLWREAQWPEIKAALVRYITNLEN